MSCQRIYKNCMNCFKYSELASKLSDPQTEIDVKKWKSYLQLRETACHFTMKGIEEMHGGGNPNSLMTSLLDECAISCDYTSPIVAELLRKNGLIRNR